MGADLRRPGSLFEGRPAKFANVELSFLPLKSTSQSG